MDIGLDLLPIDLEQPGEEKRGPWVAMYSASAVSAGHPTSFYERPDGLEVECCAVYPPGKETAYRWSDAVNLGVVKRRLRDGLPDRTGRVDTRALWP